VVGCTTAGDVLHVDAEIVAGVVRVDMTAVVDAVVVVVVGMVGFFLP
jgi:hypothetical protein